MKPISINSFSKQWPGALLLAGALLVAAVCYHPGLGGSLHFDDVHNLDGLRSATTLEGALRFISEGVAGPTGRPIALASFVPQAYAWPGSPETFLRVNILLHLLNGTLVAWVIYLLTRSYKTSDREAAWISSMTAAIWLLLPILASASLFIVQRMTTLSATFLLLSLAGYLSARQRLETHPPFALGLMSTSLIAGTAAAALTKENGALLPLFVLVTEATLLPQPSKLAASWWNLWRCIFLFFPAAVLGIYLLTRLDYGDSVVLRREFSAPERLLTEAYVLWEYLSRALLPSTSSLGPFHDDHVVYRNWFSLSSLFVVGAWACALVVAFLRRRSSPLLAFGLGWYLVGHALESTTIPLELYFEHRNYVPLIGPVFAVTAYLSSLRRGHLLIRCGMLSYVGILSVVLYSTTSLWGQPALAAEMWAIHSPSSQRATQYLAEQYETAGDPVTARRVLRRYLEQAPNATGVTLQVLALSCVLEPGVKHDKLIRQASRSLSKSKFEHGVFETLQKLYRMAEANTCEALDTLSVYELASLAASNPAYQAIPVAYHNLHVLMSEQAFKERDLGLTMQHIESALSAVYIMPTIRQAVRVLSSAGLHSTARKFVDEAAKRSPLHPVRGAIWKRQVAELKRELEAAAE